MKKRLLSVIAALAFSLTVIVTAGCSGGAPSQQGVQGGVFAQPGLQDGPVQQGGNGQTSQTQPALSNPFAGNWVHIYEYLGNTYRTTLVIDPGGTAVYYNEEAELGNFSASWYANGSGISISRSDGVTSECRIEGNTLIEVSMENGNYYEAQYQRA